ncbi:MAG: rhodanese-related sulfurtransferase [Lentisphaeria bacterium]|jgi:rhodanese-related sulfurtransferase
MHTTLDARSFLEQYRNNQNITVIDLRTGAEVDAEYIDNCIHLPVQDLNHQTLSSALNKASKDNENVLHLLCQSGRRAVMAVEKLQGLEGVELIVLEGGLNALKSLGLEVKSAADAKPVMSIERQVHMTVGILVLLGVGLGFTVSSVFFALTALLGVGLVFSGITDICGMALLLARMPWNRVGTNQGGAA